MTAYGIVDCTDGTSNTIAMSESLDRRRPSLRIWREYDNPSRYRGNMILGATGCRRGKQSSTRPPRIK